MQGLNNVNPNTRNFDHNFLSSIVLPGCSIAFGALFCYTISQTPTPAPVPTAAPKSDGSLWGVFSSKPEVKPIIIPPQSSGTQVLNIVALAVLGICILGLAYKVWNANTSAQSQGARDIQEKEQAVARAALADQKKLKILNKFKGKKDRLKLELRNSQLSTAKAKLIKELAVARTADAEKLMTVVRNKANQETDLRIAAENSAKEESERRKQQIVDSFNKYKIQPTPPNNTYTYTPEIVTNLPPPNYGDIQTSDSESHGHDNNMRFDLSFLPSPMDVNTISEIPNVTTHSTYIESSCSIQTIIEKKEPEVLSRNSKASTNENNQVVIRPQNASMLNQIKNVKLRTTEKKSEKKPMSQLEIQLEEVFLQTMNKTKDTDIKNDNDQSNSDFDEV